MTNAELKDRFLIGYEFLANNLAPGYTDSEISGLLNQAMDLLVDELYAKGDIANLAELLTKETFHLQLCTSENYGDYAYEPSAISIDFSTGFRWHVNSKAKITRTDPFLITNEWIPCELIPKELAEKWAQTAVNKPIITYPKLVIRGITFGVILLIDSYSTIATSSGLQVIYVKTPERIDVADGLSPELNKRLHQKIVDKAVAIAMKATDVQRAQAEIQTNQAI